MQVKEVLAKLDLGSSVAEFDDSLERYFVETESFRSLVQDKGDIIAGDKGTGKTALHRILETRAKSLPELKNVAILSAFNPAGAPVFQRLAQSKALTEGQYIALWKGYIVAFVGNWVLSTSAGNLSADQKRLDNMLSEYGLRTPDFTPKSVFSKVFAALRERLKSAGIEISVTQTGLPKITPKIEFQPEQDSAAEKPADWLDNIDDALELVNDVLSEMGVSAWVVLDRLDEAFQGFPEVEIPALRALLRTYLDLLAFPQIRLKLFLRRDLFRRIIGEGFVNLTHVNARKIEIIWDDDDLFVLLCKRIRESPEFVDALHMAAHNNRELFAAVFPKQVIAGEKRPETWTWIISRIRDGNNVKPPRNLIDLVKKSLDEQHRREEREAREFSSTEPIFEGEAIRNALDVLSKERVQDTLLAEAGSLGKYIEKFRDGKAEHNDASLARLFGVKHEKAKPIAKSLMEIGFLEQIGPSYKVPALYRSGLGITQGKAF